MVKFIKKIFSFFTFNNNENLDLFLQSKNAQTVSEIEYWVNQWNKNQRRGFF